MFATTLSLLAFIQVAADCPTEETAIGRLRIRNGELSCAQIAENERAAKIPPRQISASEQRRIIAHFDKLLVDGPSARWDWGKVVQGHIACFSVNSKNRMGGYAGWSRYFFDLKTGEETDRDAQDALFDRLRMERPKDICA